MKKWLTLTLAIVACMCMSIAFADLAKIGPYNITYSTSPGIATLIGTPFTLDTYSGEKANIYFIIMADLPSSNKGIAFISILPDGVPRPIDDVLNGQFTDMTINRSLNNPRDIVYAYVNDTSSIQNPTYYDRKIDGRSGFVAVPKESYQPYVAAYFLNDTTPVIIISSMSWDKTHVLLDNLHIVEDT